MILLNLFDKVDEFILNKGKNDIIFIYKNKKYFLKKVVDKIKNFSFDEILKFFIYEKENDKYVVKRVNIINNVIDINIFYKLKLENKIKYFDFFEYKKEIF